MTLTVPSVCRTTVDRVLTRERAHELTWCSERFRVAEEAPRAGEDTLELEVVEKIVRERPPRHGSAFEVDECGDVLGLERHASTVPHPSTGSRTDVLQCGTSPLTEMTAAS